jgi:hypothetical protein
LVQSSARLEPVELPKVPGGQFSGVSTPVMQYMPMGHTVGVTVALRQ